ncbi:MAG: N-6 DNA methylase [Termitinemataceae bacterium]|nr:MAG: N-6 DNA methylase [Termitinemataceae bacterium]
MALSWNEIKTRAAVFVNDWQDKALSAREEADAQTFENGFFNIFGVSRSQIAIFEHKVKLQDGSNGYIDLFWKGHILIEMKSPGKDLDKAYKQAKDYANALEPSLLPKGILICDFVNFHYYNLLEDGKLYVFKLNELIDFIELFSDLAGYKDIEYKKLDAVNVEAAQTMVRLHDQLKEIGYSGHALEVYLVRLLFCLFADDTDIFEHDLFIKYIVVRTNPDGSDLAMHLQSIFETLDKPFEKRLKNIDEQLNKFPYVNGDLFSERLESAAFNSTMRETLIDCCRLDWSKISPAIFGSMFQSVMNQEERHNLGAHYTSEENILKVIHSLFLDDLWSEFDKIHKLKTQAKLERLKQFHQKIASLKFLDPACGCGNFLVISYRELRILELEVLKELLGQTMVLDVASEILVNVNQFYGIEIQEFPCKVAQVAMWLIDHQMNTLIRDMFGQYYVRIPLTISASIHFSNAFDLDWETDIVSKKELNFILGNPPFLGGAVMNDTQKKDIERIFSDTKGRGMLDYVTCWYRRTAEYIQGTDIECAFVSTNSICQGEQVPILWQNLINQFGIKINFAHQTFKWSNEARGKAAVYCIIIGFSLTDRKNKKLYYYASITSNPVETTVSKINAYLTNADMVFIEKRGKPICNVSEMNMGSSPIDNGNFLLTPEEADTLLQKEPELTGIIRPFVAAEEFLHKKQKFCIWLNNVNPAKYQHSKEVKARIARVAEFRKKSKREATQKRAAFPMLFSEIRQPDTDYLLIPRVSSEKRKYIPIGFMSKDVIAGDTTLIIPNATLYEFGILNSSMHMAWMRYVCGRLKSDYRYSASIVYNNFPWPEPTDKQKENIEQFSQSVLQAREIYPNLSLANLYDSNTMIPELIKAHQQLDRAVERAYGKTFEDDREKVAFLFEIYQNKYALMFAKITNGKKK